MGSPARLNIVNDDVAHSETPKPVSVDKPCMTFSL